MASKRHRRRRSCSSKRSYASLAEARRAAAKLFQDTGRHCSAYGCKFCGGFHIGRQPTYVLRIIAARHNRRLHL
jgi:hypothetical protein